MLNMFFIICVKWAQRLYFCYISEKSFQTDTQNGSLLALAVRPTGWRPCGGGVFEKFDPAFIEEFPLYYPRRLYLCICWISVESTVTEKRTMQGAPHGGMIIIGINIAWSNGVEPEERSDHARRVSGSNFHPGQLIPAYDHCPFTLGLQWRLPFLITDHCGFRMRASPRLPSSSLFGILAHLLLLFPNAIAILLARKCIVKTLKLLFTAWFVNIDHNCLPFCKEIPRPMTMNLPAG